MITGPLWCRPQRIDWDFATNRASVRSCSASRDEFWFQAELAIATHFE